MTTAPAGEMTDWWAKAREREVDRLVQERIHDPEGMHGDLADALAVVSRPDWIPARKPPRLPPMWKIVRYWNEEAPGDWFATKSPNPHCFACSFTVIFTDPSITLEERWNLANGVLERGHLVNRARDGLDAVQNLVPLCHDCNRVMPIFDAPDPPGPVEWVLGGGILQYLDFLENGGWRVRKTPAWPPQRPISDGVYARQTEPQLALW